MRVKSTLKNILDERNISIGKCAEMAGLKKETVRRMYNDTTMQYQRDTLGALCKALNVGISDILDLEEKEDN
ncbi:helix-turn-helix domain-containing protein [Lysinibacillus xylanilyticus]|uniref:XRE family transcriptional regulator n=1 Tax=Lysinibacillus xylanilyticus TaxID=582475 RepID=A0A2M9QAP3_9BACI|nr:helix-turn-helix transcriptional regulator [Lysinibacillus xylanilyticus]PJO45136.1 XRE family transcriptional regulator [Lysinibacillus xylanilyticus]